MTFVSSFVPRKRASCKVVEAKISFRITTLRGVADRRIFPILTRSSSSFPLISARSSSRAKWVKSRSNRNSRAALPGTGQPTLARWWSWPKVRAKVVFPPWFGPVTTKIRSGSARRKSLVTWLIPGRVR
jgi:hypothetical protein